MGKCRHTSEREENIFNKKIMRPLCEEETALRREGISTVQVRKGRGEAEGELKD